MATQALKSASITNLDASPVVANSSGVGGPYIAKKVRDSVTPTAANLVIGSTYKMVRVPSNCYLQHIRLVADAALDSNVSPTLSVDVGAFYSDSTVDGTPKALQGTAINDNIFGDAVLFGAATTLAVTVTDGKWTAANRQTLLWSALGLSSDPGGQFDIVVTLEAAAATGVASPFQLEAEYAMP